MRDILEAGENASGRVDQAERAHGSQALGSAAEAPSLTVVDNFWVTGAVCELLVNALRHTGAWRGVEVLVNDAETRIIVTDVGKGRGSDPGARFEPAAGAPKGLLSIPLSRDLAEAYGGYLLIEKALSNEAPTAIGSRVSLILPRSTVFACR